VAGTDLGKEAKGHMDSGGLVPDKLIIDIIIARLAENDCVKNGWLLDGFPRTRGQADALAEAGLTCDTFILLNVPDHLLVERVCGRRSDPDTGIIYHIKYKPAPTEEIAARLTQRSDDTEDAITVRIQNFHANVLAIIDAYQNQLVSVDGTRAPAVVWAELQTRITRSFQREIVLATGAPGSGRREVCAEVAKQNGYRYLNVGDALRAATSHKSAELIADSMKRHEAVDPVIVMEVVQAIFDAEPMCKRWLLDGFARSSALISALGDKHITETVLHFENSVNECQLSLERRKEDHVSTRLERYFSEAQPVVDWFSRAGKTRVINLNGVPTAAAAQQASRMLRATTIIAPYERTFAMVKPDAVSQGHVPAIMEMIAGANLNGIYTNLVTMTDSAAKAFYAEHDGKAFFPRLIQFMTSGPVVVMILEGENAIKKWRALLGPTATQKALIDAPDSIRAKFGTDGTQNAAHGSDSSLSAAREINFWTDPSSLGAQCKEATIAHANANADADADAGVAEENVEAAEGATPEAQMAPSPSSPPLVRIQDTFAMIKPGTADASYQEIRDVVAAHGFEVVQELRTSLSLPQAQMFYAEHEGKPFYEDLTQYMSSGSVVALHLRREAGISAWRHLIGPTNYKKAQEERPDSIRAKFAVDGTRNAVHGSDSEASALRELSFFFSIGQVSPAMYMQPLGQQAPVAFDPVQVVDEPSPTAADASAATTGSDFVPPKRYSSKVRTVPTISNTDLTLMEAYANYDVEPVMKNLLQQLMVKRPEDVTGFALQELGKMHLASGKQMPSFDSVAGVPEKLRELSPIVSPRSQPGAGAL
jgi:nucleoside diphosphate kinase/adenylate kinase family enzyme